MLRMGPLPAQHAGRIRLGLNQRFEFLDEPALTDARGSDDRDEVLAAAIHDSAEQRQQKLEFIIAPDQRRPETPRRSPFGNHDDLPPRQ